MVVRALALGYQTVAINTEVSQHMFVTRKEKNKKVKKRRHVRYSRGFSSAYQTGASA